MGWFRQSQIWFSSDCSKSKQPNFSNSHTPSWDSPYYCGQSYEMVPAIAIPFSDQTMLLRNHSTLLLKTLLLETKILKVEYIDVFFLFKDLKKKDKDDLDDHEK